MADNSDVGDGRYLKSGMVQNLEGFEGLIGPDLIRVELDLIRVELDLI